MASRVEILCLCFLSSVAHGIELSMPLSINELGSLDKGQCVSLLAAGLGQSTGKSYIYMDSSIDFEEFFSD